MLKSSCFGSRWLQWPLIAGLGHCLLLASMPVRADAAEPAAPLQAAFLQQLASYQALPDRPPLFAQVRLRTRLEDGKDDKAQVREGDIQLQLRDGAQGLAVSFSADLMQQLNQQRERAIQNPDDIGAALTAFRDIDNLSLIHI